MSSVVFGARFAYVQILSEEARMESEGPYKHSRLSGWCVGGCMACIYAEGRKSAKKDLHYEELSLKYLVDRHKSLVDDFKELFEMANILAKNRLCHGEIHDEFDAWKKARGLI